jgi:hypothetical protein
MIMKARITCSVLTVLGALSSATFASSAVYTTDNGPITDFDYDVFYLNTTPTGTNETVDHVTSVTINNLQHTFVGDLGVAVGTYAADGTTNIYSVLFDPVELVPNNDSQLDGNYTFVLSGNYPTLVQAINALPDGATLPSGTYLAGGPPDINGQESPGDFSALDNLPLDNTWYVAIGDYIPEDSGSVDSATITFEVSPAPEPASLGLALIPAAMAIRRRRRVA